MEASMDQTCGKGSRLRRVLPFALAGVGVYAAVAYGSAMFGGAPAHLVAQKVIPADQMIVANDPLPAAAPVQMPGQSPVTGAVGQVQTVGRDVLPDAAAVTRNLNNSTTTTVIPSSATAAGSTPASSTAPASGPLSSVPIVNNLPVVSALNNVPLQNVTGSGITQPLSGLTGSATGGSGANPQPLKNLAPGLAGVSLPQVNGATPLGGLLP
jgi:hypothetical protein